MTNKHVELWAESNDLCLEFANTVHWHASAAPFETLHGYADLLAWSKQYHAIPAHVMPLLVEVARQQPTVAAAVFERGRILREAIYRVFAAQVHTGIPAQEDITILNQELRNAFQHASIVAQNKGFAWRWNLDEAQLDAPLWPIARSAAGLLTAADLLSRVGQCADERGCGWLFLDLSKNHSRRWCDINDCGNRAKQQRFQQRKKE